MAAQIFVLELIKDASADLGDEFTVGGCVGLSYCKVSQCYCQFQSNF